MTLAQTASRRLLAHDRPHDVAFVLAAFVGYFVLDRWTQAIAVVERGDLGGFSLVGAAAGHRWWLLLPLLGAFVAVAIGGGDFGRRLLCRWDRLDHGRTLRLLAAAMIALLTWQAAMYDVNFLAGRTHWLDRLLVVALAAGAIARPVLLTAFAIEVRIINEQFLHPFGTLASKNVDELLVIGLLAMAAIHLLYVGTDRNDTSPVLLILGSAVASHFFWPGKAKVVSDWVSLTDVSNLPLSSYSAGWLGGTDGGVGRAVADAFTTLSWPILIGTLVIEVGAVVAALHPKLLRIWLVGFIGFHSVTFLATGFFFLGWAGLELALLLIFSLPRFASWVATNATPARGLISAAAVVGGTILFHPPGLAWFDAPVSYGYEITAVGESGTVYNLAPSTFAPLDQDVSFNRLQLYDRSVASGGYGAISTEFELAQLEAIADFDALTAYEDTLGPPDPAAREESLAFLQAFLDATHEGSRIRWFGLDPPDRFWTSAPQPTYDFSEPLVQLDLVLVRSIHGPDGDPTYDRVDLGRPIHPSGG